MNSRRITMIIAVVVAVAAGLLTVRFLTAVDQTKQAAVVETKPIVIANRDIHVHQKITAEMLTKVMRPVDQIEPGAIADPKLAEGDVSLIALPEGSTITDTKIGQPAAIGITGKLRPGMRAVSIPMDLVKSVSGLVSPGDRVDVLASLTRSGKNPPTRTIIRGALVLAVNSQLEPNEQVSAAPNAPTAPNAPNPPPQVVTLAVTPDQANLLTFADFNSTLRLALRSPTEPVRAFPAQPLEIPDQAAPEAPRNVPPPANPPPAPQVAPPGPKAPVPAPRTSSILVIEGDQVVGASR